MNRALSIVLACTLACSLALAGAFGSTARADDARSADQAASRCCGEECRCGDSCPCSAEQAPALPGDDGRPALPERPRGERAQLFATIAAQVARVTVLEPLDLGTRATAATERPATPSCRERLALVARWTT